VTTRPQLDDSLADGPNVPSERGDGTGLRRQRLSNAPSGAASCARMSHSGMRSAPGVAEHAATGGRPTVVGSGPGVPGGTGNPRPRPIEPPETTPTTVSCENDSRAATPADVFEAVEHYRLRNAVPRTHRVNPCFSQAEWADIVSASQRCHLTPGGFTAAAAVAFSRSDRRGSFDEEHRSLDTLMRRNSTLGTIGTRLNQVARQLNSGGSVAPEAAHRLLAEVASAVTRADDAVTAISVAHSGKPAASPGPDASQAAEILHEHRRRMPEPRRNRTHPCFSDSEWADITAAARACRLKPGGYAAATALLAARSTDPLVAIADVHRQLQELM
jgi:hypothetical protein